MTETSSIPLERRRAACGGRQQYDEWIAQRLGRVIPDAEEWARALSEQYPKTVAEAVRELRFRGLFIDSDTLERWGELVGVRIEQGVQWWIRHHIDTLAEELLQAGRLMSAHYWNARQGSTWQQWLAAEFPEEAPANE